MKKLIILLICNLTISAKELYILDIKANSLCKHFDKIQLISKTDDLLILVESFLNINPSDFKNMENYLNKSKVMIASRSSKDFNLEDIVKKYSKLSYLTE